jgi:hypothetical protein
LNTRIFGACVDPLPTSVTYSLPFESTAIPYGVTKLELVIVVAGARLSEAGVGVGVGDGETLGVGVGEGVGDGEVLGVGVGDGSA